MNRKVEALKAGAVSHSGKDTSELLDRHLDSSTPPPPKIDLRDAHAVRRELCALYRDARSERITTQDASRLGYLLDLVRKGFETATLLERIELLERTIDHRRS